MTKAEGMVSGYARDLPLDTAGAAARAGISVSTVRSYIRDGHMPPPDGKLGQSLWWWTSTIDEWSANRPPAGRPRKH